MDKRNGWRSLFVLILAGAAMSALPALAEESAAKAHYDKGMALKKAKDLKGAATEFRKALSLSPEHIDSHWALAWTCAGLEQRPEAIAHFAEILKLEPDGTRATEAKEAIKRLGGTVPVPGATPQPPPQPTQWLTSADEVLEKCAAAHAGLDSLSARGTIAWDYRGARAIKSLLPVTLAYQRPNRFRIELQDPTYGYTVVSDGEKLRVYYPILKQYMESDAPPSIRFADGVGGEAEPPDESHPLPVQLLASARPLDRLKKGASKISLVGRKTLRLGEPPAPVETYHVRLTVDHTPPNVMGMAPNLSNTDLWIDARTFLIRKYVGELDAQSRRKAPKLSALGSAVTVVTTEIYHTALIDQPVSDKLFEFTPPDGVKLVKDFELPGLQFGGVDLVGKKGAKFSLTGVDGKRHSLDDYPNRPIILCFWTSGTRRDLTVLPLLDKLVEEHEADQLVALGIAFNPDGGAAGVAKELGLKHPTLIDGGAKVTRQYGAYIQPTLVYLDKLGAVRAILRGTQKESTVREKLESIGLKPGG